jgi:hypothetical protein
MKKRELDPGQVLIFRNPKGGEPDQPLWRGQARLKSGASLSVALWSRVARETEQKYLGGTVTVTDADVDVHEPQPTGTIAIFPNDNGEHEKRPDQRGIIQIDGQEDQFASLWKHQGENGPFLAGQVQPRSEIEAMQRERDDEPAEEPKQSAKARAGRGGGKVPDDKNSAPEL